MKYPEMFDLNGKIALITGASHGLGVAFAEAMAEAGADVVCADKNVQGLGDTVEKVKRIGRKALAIICDVTEEDQVVAMVKETGRDLRPPRHHL